MASQLYKDILPFIRSTKPSDTEPTKPLSIAESSIHESDKPAPEVHQEAEKPNKVKRFLSKFQSSAVRSTAEMERRDKEEERRTGVKKVVQPVSLLSVCEATTNAQAKYAWAA